MDKEEVLIVNQDGTMEKGFLIDGKLKRHEIKFKVTDGEFERIKKNTESLGSNINEYCKMVSLKTKIKFEVDK